VRAPSISFLFPNGPVLPAEQPPQDALLLAENSDVLQTENGDNLAED
jgi:hypothetical protein